MGNSSVYYVLTRRTRSGGDVTYTAIKNGRFVPSSLKDSVIILYEEDNLEDAQSYAALFGCELNIITDGGEAIKAQGREVIPYDVVKKAMHVEVVEGTASDNPLYEMAMSSRTPLVRKNLETAKVFDTKEYLLLRFKDDGSYLVQYDANGIVRDRAIDGRGFVNLELVRLFPMGDASIAIALAEQLGCDIEKIRFNRPEKWTPPRAAGNRGPVSGLKF